MILVIADDFTGAAELAGISIGFGLKTEVQTTFDINSDAEVLIIDTNTRSKTAEEAEMVLKKLLESVRQYEFDFIYKKIDSVLRGHIYEELSVMLRYYPDKSILLSPTNPSRGRTTSNGTYFIDGLPLHETVFSEDPESPIKASDIYTLVNGGEKDGIQILNTFSSIPSGSGMIYVGEAKDQDEVRHWVSQTGEGVITAGAADFFKAILESKYGKRANVRSKIDFESRNSLFVCGSSLSRVINIEEELFSQNPKVVEILENQICSASVYTLKKISKKVIEQFKVSNKVILFVTTSGSDSDQPTHNIPKCLAAITSNILHNLKLDELFIEGGTTSSEIVRKAGWEKFKAVNQMGEGLVRMQVVSSPANFITVKPGSYKWSDSLWRQLKS
ncbi:MAG: four-carbon acid sugar kinase family protein [Cyclobacteriaceae bacterium]